MNVSPTENNAVVSTLKAWLKLASVDIFRVINPEINCHGGMWWNGIKNERKHIQDYLLPMVSILTSWLEAERKDYRAKVAKKLYDDRRKRS